MSRPSRPIPIGIRVEDRLHLRLQNQVHDRLRDPVRDRRHAEHPRPAAASSVSQPPSPAAGCSSPRTSGSRPCRGSPEGSPRTPGSTPRQHPQPLVGLDPSAMPPRPAAWKSQTACRQASARSPAPPATSRLTTDQARMTRPRRSTRITGLQLPRGGPPLCPASLLSPSRIQPLGVSLPRTTAGHNRSTGRPRARTTGSHVPHQSPDQARAAFMPDTAWPISRHPPGSSRGNDSTPVSMSSSRFDTSSVVRSRSPSWPTPDALTARLFPQRSAPRLLTAAPCGGLRASPCRAAAEDHQPNNSRPPSPMQHRIS